VSPEDTLAEKRAKLIDLIMVRRRSDSRGRGVEGVESDREAIEADVIRLSDSTVTELITRFERLPGAVVWLEVA
jgi:hypothetical protein